MRLEVSPRAGRTAATVKLGLAIVLVCTLLFCLVDLLGGPIYSLSTKTWLPERRGDKLIGGIEGTVKEADSATRTVRVASGFLGLGSLPVVVTPETIIIVQGKLGGFGDLDRRLRVRVAYEILRGRLLATRVHVLDQWSQPSVVAAEPDHERARAPQPLAAPAVIPPRAPTRSATPSVSRRAPPIVIPQSDRATAPATERPTPAPPSALPTAAQDTQAPVPVTVAAPGTPSAPRAGDDALPTRTEPPHLPAQAP